MVLQCNAMVFRSPMLQHFKGRLPTLYEVYPRPKASLLSPVCVETDACISTEPEVVIVIVVGNLIILVIIIGVVVMIIVMIIVLVQSITMHGGAGLDRDDVDGVDDEDIDGDGYGGDQPDNGED